MKDIEVIQQILKKRNIDFSINNNKYDNKGSKYDVLTLIAERHNKVTGYAEFFTSLYFNKQNGDLEQVEILE